MRLARCLCWRIHACRKVSLVSWRRALAAGEGQIQEVIGRLRSWHVILALPVASDPASGLLEVGGHSEVLLSPLDLCFHSASGLRPFLHHLLGLFVSSFVRELLVPGVQPDLLQFLLVHFSSWVVELVARPSFKPVFLPVGLARNRESWWLSRGVVDCEGGLSDCLLLLLEL